MLLHNVMPPGKEYALHVNSEIMQSEYSRVYMHGDR